MWDSSGDGGEYGDDGIYGDGSGDDNNSDGGGDDVMMWRYIGNKQCSIFMTEYSPRVNRSVADYFPEKIAMNSVLTRLPGSNSFEWSYELDIGL